jgi:CHAT domain-containing protein
MAVSQKNINLLVARNNGLKTFTIFSSRKKIESKSSKTYKKLNNSSSFSWYSSLAIAPLKAHLALLPCLAMGTLLCDSAQAQSIIPDANGTGTVVSPAGNRIDITGGTLSGNGQNLFHSFTEFGLTQDQIANFLSNDAIKNILGRVNGGNPSVINGLIQVTGGNSNLFLMNPAGIVFGQNARLNVQGDFTATTASGIGFANGWFNAYGLNNYAALDGNPSAFSFPASASGTITNSGNLAVNDGKNLSLVGSAVVNTGELKSPGGNITIAAVPGTNTVRISKAGNVLSLELENPGAISPLSLPGLLTGGNVKAGEAAVSGTLDASGETGGVVQVLGSSVKLTGNALINVSGDKGGGTALIGGDYQGNSKFNATTTSIDKGAIINADAGSSGNGGKVIAWADNTTSFLGFISAKGGENSGNGGFVEVSGKESLNFNGLVNLLAPQGQTGNLLLDPSNIDIDRIDGGNATTQQIAASTLVSQLSLANVSLLADSSISVNSAIDATGNVSNNSLSLNARTVNLNAPINVRGNLSIASSNGGQANVSVRNNVALNTSTAKGEMNLNALIQLENGASLSASTGGGNLNVGTVRGRNGENVALDSGTGTLTVQGRIGNGYELNSISLTGNRVNLNDFVSGKRVLLQPSTPSMSIGVGDGAPGDWNATANLSKFIDNFEQIVIGRADGTGPVTVNSISSIVDPVKIQSPGGTMVVNGFLTGVDNASYELTAANITLNADITTPDQNIVLNGNVTLAKDVELNTRERAPGDIIINGNVDGNHSLILSTGSGAITTKGTIGGTVPLTNLSFLGFNNNINVGNIGTPTTPGFTGTFNLNPGVQGNVTLIGDTYNATQANYLVANNRDLNINSGTTTTFYSNGSPLTINNTIRLAAGSSLGAVSGGGNITLGAVRGTRNADVTLDAGAGAVTAGAIGNPGEINAIKITADGIINLTDKVFGNTALLQPSSPAKDIAIGVGSVGSWNPTAALDKLQNGFSLITVGRADGFGNVAVSPLTVNDPFLIQSPGGAIAVNGQITGQGDASITLNSVGTILNAGITTADRDININSNVLVGQNVALDTGASGGGNINLNGAVDGPAALNLSAGTGDINAFGTIGGVTALTALNAAGNNINVVNIGSAIASGVIGSNILTATGDINIAGTNINAGSHAFTSGAGKTFNFVSGAKTNVISSGGAIAFNNGNIQLSNGSDLNVTSNNGNVALTNIQGTSHQDLTVNAGTGSVTVGAIGGGNGINTVDITALSGVNLYGNITTSDAAGNNVSLTGPVNLGTGITINTDTAGSDGNVAINGSINGNAPLAITAGSGNIGVTSTIGGAAALTNLDMKGANISVANIGTDAAAGVSGNTNLSATGSLNFTGTTVNANQQIYTAAAVNINAGAPVKFTSSGDAIAFNTSAVKLGDNSDLAINSNGGNISLPTVRGTSLESLSLNAGAGTIQVGAIGSGNEIKAVDITATGGVGLNGNITTGDAPGNNVAVTGPIQLGTDIKISTDNATNDGNVTFNGTIDGAKTLEVQAGFGTINAVGAIGTTTPLNNLSFSAGNISINNLGTGTTPGVTGTTSLTAINDINFTGTNYNANAQNYTAKNFNLVAGAPTTFTSSNDPISFNNGTAKLSEGTDLIVNSNGGNISVASVRGTSSEDVTLNAAGGSVSVGAIGSGNEINTVNVTGNSGITLKGNITTSDAAGNDVTLTGPVNIATGVTINTDNATTDGNVTFSSTINGPAGLTVTSGQGKISVPGTIGGATALESLNLTGDITLANIGTTTAAGVNGSTSLNSTNDLNFTGTTYNANGQNYTVAPGKNFNILAGAPTTFTSSNDAISFNTGTTKLANGSDLIVNSNGGNISLATVRGTSSEDVNITAAGGSVSVGAIGNADEINTVDIQGNAGITLNGDITTSDAAGNNVNLNGPVKLGTDIKIKTDNANTDGNININGTTDGNHALILTAGKGTITTTGAIGSTAALNSLDVTGSNINIANIGTNAVAGVNGNTTINAEGDLNFTGTTYTANQQNYTVGVGRNFNMVAGAPTTFTSTNDAISFNVGTVQLKDGSDLTVNSNGGAIAMQDVRGTSSEDVNLNAAAGTVKVGAIGNGNEINTVDISGGGGVTLNGNITTSDAPGNNVTVNGPVTFPNDLKINTDNATNDGNININGNVDSERSLTLTAGTGNIGVAGLIGSTTALSNIDFVGGNIAVNNIGSDAAEGVKGGVNLNASSDITFTGTTVNANQQNYTAGKTFNIAAGAPTTFTSSGDAINFNNGKVQLGDNSDLTVSSNGGNIAIASVDGTSSEDLKLKAGSGSVNIGAIGSSNGINTVDIEADGGIKLAGNITTSDAPENNVSFKGAVNVSQNITIDTDNATNDGNVNFSSTVDGNGGLTINAGGGSINFPDTIGGKTALSTLNLSAGNIALADIGTNAAEGVSGGTNISASNDINFNGKTYNANQQSYTAGNEFKVNAGETTNFTSSGDAISFKVGTIKLADGSDLVVTSNNGDIALSNVRGTSNETLKVQAGTGSVNVGAIGSGNEIAAIDIGGKGGITLNGDIKIADAPGNNITLNDPVKLGSDITINTDNATNDGNINFNGTLDGGKSLTLNAGSGEVAFNGIVGGKEALGGLTINNLGLLKIANGADMKLAGSFAQNGTGSVSTGGNINAASIQFNSPISLTNAVSFDSKSNITINGKIEGNQNLSMTAGDAIAAREINTSSTSGNAGNVTLKAKNDIEVNSINTQASGGGLGGKVDISTGKFLRVTGIFTDQNGQLASISTADGGAGGAIAIQHGGGIRNVPFVVGDATTNGTAAGITTSAGNIILPPKIIRRDYTQGNISITTPIPPAPPQITPALEFEQSTSIPNAELDLVVAQLDEPFTRQFEQYGGASSKTPIKTITEARETLRQTEASTGVRSAFIYVVFASSTDATEVASRTKNLKSQGQSSEEELELVIVTAQGQPIRKRVEGASRSQVLQVAKEFSTKLSNPQKTRDYLVPSQQLYKWLLAPMEADLQARGIENLVFLMDTGLRSLPIAALYNGQEFLVEKYSVSLMPSLSLTDTRYANLRQAKVLAMGADRLTGEAPLPSVPVELQAIASGTNKFFLNEAFTLDNLKAQVLQQPFGIVHLASHSEFNSGVSSNSYLRLWDTKLSLDLVRELGWKNSQVELLVLSASRSTMGDEQAELGFAGLAMHTGAKSALASLWCGNDEGTLRLITDFYEQLKTAPIKAEALRRSQLAMLRGGAQSVSTKVLPEIAKLKGKDLSHPYYWAAFTMIGNPW